jgi:hypothetical protein
MQKILLLLIIVFSSGSHQHADTFNVGQVEPSAICSRWSPCLNPAMWYLHNQVILTI